MGIRQLIESILELSGSRINFEIKYTELAHSGQLLIYESSFLEITAFPLTHRIATYGYLFKEKQRPLRMRKEMIAKYQLTTEQILDAKSGSDLTINRVIVPVEELTFPPDLPRSYAYCSDTAYDERLLPFIKNVDVLYHETTFMSNLEELAKFSKHSTSVEAAVMAKNANAGWLITGHYSSRYKDLEPLLNEAQEEFSRTILGLEGKVYNIDRRFGLQEVEKK